MEAFLFFTFILSIAISFFLIQLSKYILEIRAMLILASQDKYTELKALSESLSKNKKEK